MCVCVCVCVCMCMHALCVRALCMYARVDIAFLYLCACMCAFVCLSVGQSVHMHACTDARLACMHTKTCMHVQPRGPWFFGSIV